MRRGPLVISLVASLLGLLLHAEADAKPKRLPPQKEVGKKAPERLARRDDGLVAEPKGITWIVRPGQRAGDESKVAKAKPAKIHAVKRTAQRGSARAGRVARGRGR